MIMYGVVFLIVLGNNNTDAKPYETHHQHNKIFEHFNPNVVARWFVADSCC